MEQRVREFLSNNPQFPGLEEQLETLPDGRVSGSIIWEGFAGHDQYARQEILRQALRHHLDSDIQLVGVLLTYTPDEIREMVAA